MATHSSSRAWRIPWAEEPGGLPSMGSYRVGHDRSDLASAAAAAAINTECIVCNCSSPDASSKQYHSISFDENQSLIFISISVFLQPHGPQPTGLLCPWDSPGTDTGVNFHALLQGIFSIQRSKPGILHCRRILHHLSHHEALNIDVCICISFLVYLDYDNQE